MPSFSWLQLSHLRVHSSLTTQLEFVSIRPAIDEVPLYFPTSLYGALSPKIGQQGLKAWEKTPHVEVECHTMAPRCWNYSPNLGCSLKNYYSNSQSRPCLSTNNRLHQRIIAADKKQSSPGPTETAGMQRLKMRWRGTSGKIIMTTAVGTREVWCEYVHGIWHSLRRPDACCTHAIAAYAEADPTARSALGNAWGIARVVEAISEFPKITFLSVLCALKLIILTLLT
ncbi:hypothetical protein TIFTF001_018556 [Ficus carica]|uniref:Uncharacterized protein n=1 Tax=Ficus carica TaxID=3494 RepID=A0AA88AE91_FICCA|nr:hypothetical protein TIFTF001_018556 [Ficus carica]